MSLHMAGRVRKIKSVRTELRETTWVSNYITHETFLHSILPPTHALRMTLMWIFHVEFNFTAFFILYVNEKVRKNITFPVYSQRKVYFPMIFLWKKSVQSLCNYGNQQNIINRFLMMSLKTKGATRALKENQTFRAAQHFDHKETRVSFLASLPHLPQPALVQGGHGAKCGAIELWLLLYLVA